MPSHSLKPIFPFIPYVNLALFLRSDFAIFEQHVIELESLYEQTQDEVKILNALLNETKNELLKQSALLQTVDNENGILQSSVIELQSTVLALKNEIESKKLELFQIKESVQEIEISTHVLINKRPLESILRDIQKTASFAGITEKADIDLLTQEIKRYYPEKISEIKSRINIGKQIASGLDDLYKLANEQGKNSTRAQARYLNFCKEFGYLRIKAESQLSKGDAARQRRQEEQRNKNTNIRAVQIAPRQIPDLNVLHPNISPITENMVAFPISSVFHPQDVRAQKTSSNWFLIIDETGNVFSQDENLNEIAAKDLGRWVGLLLPEDNHGLKPLANWHAVDKTLAEIDRVVQCVLDANVAVLGLTLEQMPFTTGEQWTSGILAMIDWILRLVPLEENVKTKIHVQIENRGDFKKGMEWQALPSDALRRLGQSYPDRASQLELKITIIDKNGSPFNGYVDALAFTWGSPTNASKERLNDTKFLGTCFLEGNAKQIMQCWEWFDRGITIRPADWFALLQQPDSKKVGSLVFTILERLGLTTKNDVALWRSFLNETRQHLDGKAVNLAELSNQINWLDTYAPKSEKMPGKLRLLWLTSKLAHANHLGELEKEWMHEMQYLGNQLIDEDAPLVCWTDLHLAVNATNNYNFPLASQLLSRWKQMPCNVAGLRYAAQVESSLGQHAAFSFNPQQAIEHFNNALALFEKLSDETQKQKEIQQTTIYLAIVEIDYSEKSQTRLAIKQALGENLNNVIDTLAISDSENDKYRHHLLLRWLVYCAEESEKVRYLSHQDNWKNGHGHPWPLIQLYRAVLIHKTDTRKAIEIALEAYHLTTRQNQGATVRLIGFCCRLITISWGEQWQEAQIELQTLKLELPMANSHIDVLQNYLNTSSTDALVMLQKVLPFNFH
jgi:hypothetical protein